MDKQSLFSEFETVTSKQWKQKIQVDLKGADYNETLVWESLEGIKIKPFYNADDLTNVISYKLPKNHVWQVGQTITVDHAAEANKNALDAIARGTQSIVFDILDQQTEWEILLKDIDLTNIPIHFNLQFLALEPLKKLADWVGNRKVSFFLNLDIVGHLARTGNWFHNMDKDHKLMDSIVQLMDNHVEVANIAVDMALYQNAGANAVQQLAYGLAHANEYLNHFDHAIPSAKEKPVAFKVAIGPNYFFEIAKLRALRWLWGSIANHYGLNRACHILAVPSKRNKTLYDYNVNMLRTTSECMAAVLGGANTVSNLTYDTLFHQNNGFGERIARNQLLLLKEECYFDEACNASEGNYYIESLTQQLAEKALELFKQIEASGGFLKELKKGIIQKKTKENAAKEQRLFDEGKLVLLGTNKYQNPEDKMKDSLELDPFLKTNKRKTLIEPILEKRLSESLEQNRLNDE